MKKTACPASQAVFAVYDSESESAKQTGFRSSADEAAIKSEGCLSPTEDSPLVTILNRYTI
jgi:hypothetical protein